MSKVKGRGERGRGQARLQTQSCKPHNKRPACLDGREPYLWMCSAYRAWRTLHVNKCRWRGE